MRINFVKQQWRVATLNNQFAERADIDQTSMVPNCAVFVRDCRVQERSFPDSHVHHCVSGSNMLVMHACMLDGVKLRSGKCSERDGGYWRACSGRSDRSQILSCSKAADFSGIS